MKEKNKTQKWIWIALACIPIGLLLLCFSASSLIGLIIFVLGPLASLYIKSQQDKKFQREAWNGKDSKQCPYCKSEIPLEAQKCSHCQSDLRSWSHRHQILSILIIIVTIFVALMVVGIIFSGVTFNKTPLEKSNLSLNEIKNNSVKVSYDELFRNNEKYVGKIVYYRGEVSQAVESWGNEYTLRVFVTKGEYDMWSDDVLVNYAGDRVLENDIVDVWGEVRGVKGYTTVLGASRSIPEIDALHLEVVKNYAGVR